MSKQLKNGKCSCWKPIDNELEKNGCGIDYSWDFSGKTYIKVATHRTDNKRKPPMSLYASFCPFCGEKLK